VCNSLLTAGSKIKKGCENLKISQTSIRLIIWSAIVSAAGFGVALFFLWDAALFLGAGVGIGFLASVIRTINLDLSLAKLENFSETEISAAKSKHVGGLILRQFIMVAALFLPVLLTDEPRFRLAGILGAFIALLSMRIAAMFVKVPKEAEKPAPRPQTKGGEGIDGL
jgi:hypothetical protein